jgi:hypothetical protein
MHGVAVHLVVVYVVVHGVGGMPSFPQNALIAAIGHGQHNIAGGFGRLRPTW